MLTISVLFVGLTLATAVIAYWSDNLGKKLGKKRVSLWGMRPRTTATFLTIASSWLIMVFTLGVLLTIFPLLRQSLLHYDEVKAQERVLRQSAQELTGQVGALGGQVKSLQTRFSQASSDLQKVSDKLRQSSQAARSARQEQQVAERQAVAARQSADASRQREKAASQREKDARANLKTVTLQRDATEQQRRDAQRRLQSAQDELKKAGVQVQVADARVRAADARVEAAKARVAGAETRVKEAQAKLDAVQGSLDAARQNQKVAEAKTALAQKREFDANQKRVDADAKALASYDASLKAEQKVIKAEQKVTEAQQKLARLEQQRQKLQEANDLLFEENRAVGSERDIVLGNDIRVPVGFTLVARTFEQDVSFSQATRRLRALFEEGEAVIAPAPGKPALLPGARLQLATRQELLPKLNASDPDVLVVVDEDEIYNTLADAISRSQTPLSVRLVSDRNHLAGQKFLYTRFILVPVRPALQEGVELASATFDETLSDARLFSALLKLVEAGRRVAVQSGVTPPLAPDNPDSPDAPDSRDFYAPGSKERIFEALRKISAQGGRARVRLVTDKAISTVDQLSVRFEVEPLASAPARSVARNAPA